MKSLKNSNTWESYYLVRIIWRFPGLFKDFDILQENVRRLPSFIKDFDILQENVRYFGLDVTMSPHIHHLFIPSLDKETQSDSFLADLVLLHPWLKGFFCMVQVHISWQPWFKVMALFGKVKVFWYMYLWFNMTFREWSMAPTKNRETKIFWHKSLLYHWLQKI